MARAKRDALIMDFNFFGETLRNKKRLLYRFLACFFQSGRREHKYSTFKIEWKDLVEGYYKTWQSKKFSGNMFIGNMQRNGKSCEN